MRRARLATRISLLSVGIAVLTALIAGALAVGLIRNAGTGSARKTLARLADVTQSVATGGGTAQHVPLARLRNALQGLNVRAGVITPQGTVQARVALVRKAVTPTDIRDVLAGQAVSAQREVAGNTVYVEARPAGTGGIVIVQRKDDAVAQDERAIRSTIVALLVAGALAAVIGLLVAWRLARPLRRTAEAAHSLAAGRRDIVLPAQGPAEIVEVSEAVNRLAAALRFSEERQREFLLSVSHDLRTPLTAITGYAESLAEGVVPEGEAAAVGTVVLSEAQRLERLVGDLLDLARLGARDFRVELVPVEIVGLVRAAGQAWAVRAATAQVVLHLDVPAYEIWAHTDAARLRQILDGLFDNALRVTPAGAPIVLAARVETSPVVEVRDGGPGLSDDDLAVAFEQGALHQRYAGVRPVGTGLGLAIVHGLVTRLGGRIEAGHAPEGGARFTVRVPPSAGR